MSAKEMAIKLQQWAIDQGLMDFHGPSGTFHELEDEDSEDTAHLYGASQIDLLRNKQISLIGFNEKNKEVIIFLKRVISSKDLDTLNTGDDQIRITYLRGTHAAIKGLPPDPVGIPTFTLYKNRYTCGSSVYVGNGVGAGTLGCLVRDGEGNLFGLSNNHITGSCNWAQPGLPIVAPGPLDVVPNGHDPFTIGYHHRLIEMVDGMPGSVNIEENNDAAIFRIKSEDLVSSMQRDIYDTPNVVSPIQPGMNVEMVGRTSGHREGVVRAQTAGPYPIAYSIPEHQYRNKTVYYNPLFIVEGSNNDFCLQGDSGSLVTSNIGGKRHAVGIVVAMTNEKLGILLSLDKILNYFSVRLVSGHNV